MKKALEQPHLAVVFTLVLSALLCPDRCAHDRSMPALSSMGSVGPPGKTSQWLTNRKTFCVRHPCILIIFLIHAVWTWKPMITSNSSWIGDSFEAGMLCKTVSNKRFSVIVSVEMQLMEAKMETIKGPVYLNLTNLSPPSFLFSGYHQNQSLDSRRKS